MASEQKEILFDFLHEIGFASEELIRRIRVNMNLGMARFTEKETIWFGDEQMQYHLNFARTSDPQSYQLTDFDAIYREPIHIQHAVINDINTEKLEEAMLAIDWATAMKVIDRREVSPPGEYATFIRETVRQVWNLSADNNLVGTEIQKQLRLKYWLDTSFDLSQDLQQLRHEWEVRRTFPFRQEATCNTNLAYHILSGRMDDLTEIIRMTGAEKYFSTSLEITNELRENRRSFELKAHRNNSEADVEMVMPVSKTEGWYSVNKYTISVNPHPPIAHGTFGGVNTEELEARMHEIDWHDDAQLFSFQEDDVPKFFPKVEEVLTSMDRLTFDQEGFKVAQSLQLKYWADALFLDYLIDQQTWDLLESRPKRTQQFPAEMDVKSAVNLLLGRPVMDNLLNSVEGQTNNWMRLDLDKPVGPEGYNLVRFKGPTEDEVIILLRMVPFDRYDRLSYRELIAGDLLMRRLVNGQDVKLELNLEKKTLDFYTPNGNPILNNLQFDPEWNPSQTLLLKSEETITPRKNYVKKAHQSKRLRGKGL